MKRVYLDHSATTQVDARVAQMMMETLTDKFGNPSSLHGFGRIAKEMMEESRQIIADILKCDSKEIFFTSGGTEADNLALLGTVAKGERLVTTQYEHHAVLYTADYLQKSGCPVTYLKPNEFGEIFPEAVAEAMRPGAKLVSVMHINNEIGTINDIKSIAETVKSSGGLFHTDAVQSFGKVPIDLSQIPIDLMSISGHKIYGPKGIGALFIRKNTPVNPRTFGGHHERGLRAGTENLPGIVGLGKATQICQETMNSETERIGKLRDKLHQGLKQLLPDIRLNGHPNKRLYTLLNLTFPGIEGETLLMSLDMKGIAVSTGSACSSGSTNPSHVLTAIGLTAEEAQSSMRFSLGRENTEADIDYVIDMIVNIVDRIKRISI
jgi:cysteine desulfurase